MGGALAILAVAIVGLVGATFAMRRGDGGGAGAAAPSTSAGAGAPPVVSAGGGSEPPGPWSYNIPTDCKYGVEEEEDGTDPRTGAKLYRWRCKAGPAYSAKAAGASGPTPASIAAGAAAGAAIGGGIDAALGGREGTVQRTAAQLGGAVVGAGVAVAGVGAAVLAVPAALGYGIAAAYQVNLDTNYGQAQNDARREFFAKVEAARAAGGDAAAAETRARLIRENVSAYVAVMQQPRGLGQGDGGHLRFHLARGQVIGEPFGGWTTQEDGRLKFEARLYDWRKADPLAESEDLSATPEQLAQFERDRLALEAQQEALAESTEAQRLTLRLEGDGP